VITDRNQNRSFRLGTSVSVLVNGAQVQGSDDLLGNFPFTKARQPRKLDGGAPADEKRSQSVNNSVVRKSPQNRKSGQQNQPSSQNLLTDPFSNPLRKRALKSFAPGRHLRVGARHPFLFVIVKAAPAHAQRPIQFDHTISDILIGLHRGDYFEEFRGS
jgi:hypothetical protein